MRSVASHEFSSSAWSPLPSLPMSNAVGVRQSHVSMLDSAAGAVPTISIFLAFIASTSS